MGLDLNIAKLSGVGRLPVPLEYDVVRPLNEADLHLLATVPKGSVPSPLKRITDRHHSLARLLAAGVGEGEAAIQLGYDPSRVSILKNSPAFVELLALYRKEAKDQFVSNLEHMSGLSRDALLELRDRLENTPERFSVADLRQIVVEMVDRVPAEDPLDKITPDMIELVAPNLSPRDRDNSEEA